MQRHAAHAWIVVGMTLVLSSRATGQMVEEVDRDEPPVERPAEVPAKTDPDLSQAEKLIVHQTNQFRQQQELDSVAPNEKLNETAQYFADFMARTGKYGHTADGQQPSERASNHGYEYCIVAENIAYQYRSTGFSGEQLASKFVTGWKESPEHRENMLDPDVLEIGVAIARKKDAPEYSAVQMFGRPKSKSISFQVGNQSDTEVSYTVTRRGAEQTFPLPPRSRRSHHRCRPTEIEFDKADTTLEVNGGEHLVVEQAGPDAKLRVSQRN